MALALTAAGHDVTTIDPTDGKADLGAAIKAAEAIFPILHGAGGEDGSIQSTLEVSGKAFLGTGSEVSRLSFNKLRFKEVMVENGILTPNWQIVDRNSFASSGLTHQPYVLKPIEGGSSIDMFIVHNPGHQIVNVDAVFERYGKMLLEELIIGQEVTVAVLGDAALPVILIIPPDGEEFDYENKYNGKTSEIVDPESVAPVLKQAAQDLAERIHALLPLRHLSRIDMIITPDGAIYTLEANTMPGLTRQSLFPKAAAAAGITMPRLVQKLLDLLQ